jgi:hypothetical protein
MYYIYMYSRYATLEYIVPFKSIIYLKSCSVKLKSGDECVQLIFGLLASLSGEVRLYGQNTEFVIVN